MTLVTTNVVVVETYALLLNRTGEGRAKAIQFLDHLKASRVRIERVTEDDEDRPPLWSVRTTTRPTPFATPWASGCASG